MLPPQTVMHNPSVEAFYREHGIELRETPPWELCETYGEMRVVSGDESRVEFDLRLGDAVAVSTVDGRGTLLSFERES
uniref:DUF7351 domain-containing protein n=2 Tax=Haloarcula TaxID=2237 RepID=UPI0023E7879A|nr:hypothetical protein [Halomicroarcula sp. SYNS111]